MSAKTARRERVATRLVSADGGVRDDPLDADQQAALFVRCLYAGRPGLVEVAAGWRRADGSLRMRSRSRPERFPPATEPEAVLERIRHHRQAGEEVFATPLTRRHPRPDRDDQPPPGRDDEPLPGTVVWIDIDEPDELARLRRFPHRPQLVVYSGSGGAHAYWRLAREAEPAALEQANRRLAGALGGDLASTDRARLMRVPGSLNGKAGRACRLAFCDLAHRGYRLEELVDGLPDPQPPPQPTPVQLRRRARWLAGDDAATLPPPAYFRALAGIEVPDRGGYVCCPLPDHQERIPSLMVYASVERGWHCYGCQRGGRIYDLASLLDGGAWGRALRGQEFDEIKRRVHRQLGLHDD